MNLRRTITLLHLLALLNLLSCATTEERAQKGKKLSATKTEQWPMPPKHF